MKGEQLFRAIGQISDDKIVEGENSIVRFTSTKSTWLRWASMAACLLLALLGCLLLLTRDDNSFIVKAYALGQQTGGELSQSELFERYDRWGGYYDGEVFYVGVGLKCEGENIESVEFYVSEGFFASQRTGNAADSERVPKMYTGPENRLAMYGEEFNVIGDSVTLDKNTVNDELLMFWGVYTDWDSIPEKIDVHANAMLSNGKTSEQTVTIDLSGQSAMLIKAGAIPGWDER